VVEHLPSKHRALSLNPTTAKKKKKKKKKENLFIQSHICVRDGDGFSTLTLFKLSPESYSQE
jgi:hypothetical protein